MALKTPEQYEECLRKMNFKIYLMGELVENPVDHPIIRPSMNSVKMTYALAQDPQHEDLMTATSHLTGKKINRFCHLHQSTEDLVKKVKMQRFWGRRRGPAFSAAWAWMPSTPWTASPLRWTRNSAPNTTSVSSSSCRMMQEEDLTVDGAMTDPKGDRSLSPSKQADPDLFMRMSWRRTKRRHRRPGSKGPPDGGDQFPLDSRDADHDHDEGGQPTMPFPSWPLPMPRVYLHLRPPVLRHAQAGGRRDRRGQPGIRRSRGPDGFRQSVCPLGERVHVRGIRIQRRPGGDGLPGITARATAAAR